MKSTVRINFEFPKEEQTYLKMICAKKNMTLKKFASDLLLEAIEDFEDQELLKLAEERLSDEVETIEWDKMCKLVGWNV